MGEQKVVFADLAAHLTKKGSAVDDKELASKTFVGKCIYDWDNIQRIGVYRFDPHHAQAVSDPHFDTYCTLRRDCA